MLFLLFKILQNIILLSDLSNNLHLNLINVHAIYLFES